MKLEARIFLGIALFCFIITAVYAWWTQHDMGSVEWAGTAGLLLSGGLLGLGGSFFWFVSRRIDDRPEDRNDAEIADGAGELGFFSPGSYWPIGIALSATVTGVGFALVQFWLVGVGVVLILTSVAGLLFEYYVGARAPLR
ncbi:cytochrome c oxidase subunit 4 [Jatrophihabitans sp. DSM 45814]